MNVAADIAHRLHEQELKLLAQLRSRAGQTVEPHCGFGERVADKVAATMGSWPFTSSRR